MVLYNESLQISKSMTKCDAKPSLFIEFPHHNSKNLIKIIDENSQEFIDFIHKIGLSVKHNEQTINFKNSSTTILTLKTTCFKVDFNDYLVKITALL
jgi:hypothetical protein